MVEPYRNPVTGEFEGVPHEVRVVASALYSGVSCDAPAPTITDAFKFYLKENVKPIPEQHKKQQQRFMRAEKNLIAAVGSDKKIADLQKADVRAWRDMRMAAGVQVSTLRREKNDIATVITTAINELDADGTNPFHSFKLPADASGHRDKRKPLPSNVIESIYALLENEGPQSKALLDIWTLMDFTGARPSEIRMLVAGEIHLDCTAPYELPLDL